MTTQSTGAEAPNNEKLADYNDIAEKVRSGEYFRNARNIYDIEFHDPMAERYIHIFITTISLIIFLIVLKAMQDLYPLNVQIPIIMQSENSFDDAPHIRSLTPHKADNPDAAMLYFLLQHYTVVREEYDIATFDSDVNGVKSQSSEDLIKTYQEFIDPRNPESPITLYQRHSKRKIRVLSVRESEDSAEIIFEARLEERSEIKKSHWRANISFQYNGLELDDKTGKVKPLKFLVTKYHSKRLQEER